MGRPGTSTSAFTCTCRLTATVRCGCTVVVVLSALAGIQAPIIMMSQNRAAARDEILADHHYEETQKIDELLQANTEVTRGTSSAEPTCHSRSSRFGRSARRRAGIWRESHGKPFGRRLALRGIGTPDHCLGVPAQLPAT
jgi:hypothetical protein